MVRYATQLWLGVQVTPTQSELTCPPLPCPPVAEQLNSSTLPASHGQQPVYTTSPPQSSRQTLGRTHRPVSHVAPPVPPLLVPPLLVPPLLVPPLLLLPPPPLVPPLAFSPAWSLPAPVELPALPPLTCPALPLLSEPSKFPSSPQAPNAAEPAVTTSTSMPNEGLSALVCMLYQCCCGQKWTNQIQNVAARGQKANARLALGRINQGRTTLCRSVPYATS